MISLRRGNTIIMGIIWNMEGERERRATMEEDRREAQRSRGKSENMQQYELGSGVTTRMSWRHGM